MPQQCRNNKLLVHAAVVLLGIVLGRAARRRQNTAPASTPAAFVAMLLETPQPLLLATTRLQVDKFPRGTVGDARRSLNGALDVRAAKRRSPAFRALWRRRRRSLGGDARAGEARRAVDDYVVAHARGLHDAGAAAAALPYVAWLGLPNACAVLAAMAPEGLRPARDGLRRSPLHVAAARGHADAYAVLLKAARRAGVRGAARTPDALGGKARDYVAVAPNCSEVFPGTDADAATALERYALVGAPVLLRGAAAGWNWTGWNWSALERRDDVPVAPQDIPHGDSFGLAPPNTTTLGDFARDPGGMYVFDAGAAADALFSMGDVRRRVEALVRPSLELDELLDGFPRRLHEREHGRNAQVYAGPAGAGAPWHYHEQAVNALGFGRKTWYLRPPPTATYSVQAPRHWLGHPRDAVVCEQRAGDILYVPGGWGHAVVNEEPSVGAAVEFVDAVMVYHQNVRLVPLVDV
ncbi:unnamed protein product [Pelagomonas calceolata]|uniref:JmjC domain-containing protein n=1 Tax=Pelagomonas calceolata TaxID=35677 RepID=A0A8J2SRE6_9STRA|nr:unnamed protein product [Pelagomonas calceolata]